MIKWIKWFFSSTKKPIVEDIDVYGKLIDLERRCCSLEKDVVKLKEENVETTNLLYEIMNNIDAVDTRIDILNSEKFLNGELNDS